jgi:UDP-N-acetyl-D-mannosaminuronic acid transferase (WecB/TagA/CpsF family)
MVMREPRGASATDTPVVAIAGSECVGGQSEHARAHRRARSEDRLHPEPDYLHHLQRNKALYEAYRQAHFITADSKYVYWALGWIGWRIKEKVSGSDIEPTFGWQRRPDPHANVFLLGAAVGIAEIAREMINARCGAQYSRRGVLAVDRVRYRQQRGL